MFMSDEAAKAYARSIRDRLMTARPPRCPKCPMMAVGDAAIVMVAHDYRCGALCAERKCDCPCHHVCEAAL